MTQNQPEKDPRCGVDAGEKSSNYSPKIEPPGDPSCGEKSADFFPTQQPTEGESSDHESAAPKNPYQVLDHLRVSRGQVPQRESNDEKSPPAKRGRPVVFDEIAKARVLGLITAGVSQRTAAAYLNIDHTTISKAIKSDPDFARGVEQAQAAARVHPLLRIHKMSETRFEAARYIYEKVQPRTDISEAREAEAAREQADLAAQSAQESDEAWHQRVEQFMERTRNKKHDYYFRAGYAGAAKPDGEKPKDESQEPPSDPPDTAE